MTHYRMLDRAPSVVVTSNRNELKLYQGNQIYLNDGDNFELRFFNPLAEKIGVEIMFNGIKKGDSYLVLNPGQDLILDRFLDEQRKMIFETYVVDGNNEAAVKAIQQNGLISFNFYKEYYNYNTSLYNHNMNIDYNFPPKQPKYKKSKGYGYSGPGTSGASGLYGTSGISGCVGSPGFSMSGCGGGTSTSSNIYSKVFSTIFTSFDSNFGTMKSATTSYTSTCAPNQLETGRIEMGDISDQKLKSVNAQFALTPFHTISYKLMPYSAMNREIGEVRMYCSECGYRLRKETWSFCPKCGTKLS